MSTRCCICDKPFDGYGNDPWPVKLDGVCCNACNMGIVLPARIRREEERRVGSTKTTVVEVTCIMCGTPHTIMVPTEGYKKWAQGRAKIQDALPSLSAEEREMLMSNICGRCFDKMFGGE